MHLNDISRAGQLSVTINAWTISIQDFHQSVIYFPGAMNVRVIPLFCVVHRDTKWFM
jgi:hypothetical protein